MDTQVTIGDNVEKLPQRFDLDVSIPSPKRQKTRPSDHSPDPIQRPGDKELELLNADGYTISRVPPSHKPRQPASIKSLGSVMYVNAKPLVDNRVKEYLSVENTMDSNGKKRTKHHGNRFRANCSMSSNISGIPANPASSESNPIDLSGDDGPEEDKRKQRPQTTDRGIGRDRTKATPAAEDVNGLPQPRDTGERSKHFEDPGIRDFHIRPQSVTKSQNGILARQFRDTNGKRRSKDLSCSSDELDSATTVGVVVNRSPTRQLTPQPRSRHSTPTKDSSSTQKVRTPAEKEVSVPPSIVRTTTFSVSGAKRQGQKLSAYQNHYGQEKTPSWGIPLAGISFGGQFKRSKGLGLEFDEKTQSYVILDEGKNLTTSHSSLRIQPNKLLKVYWAESGGKVRFESSKSGNNDTKLDLELQSEKDLHDLLERLQYGKSIRVASKPRDLMELMFGKNISEQKNVLASPRAAVSEVPEDVQLAARNTQRRDEAKTREEIEQSSHKRSRIRHRTVDRLNDGSYQDLASQGQQVQSKTASIFKDTLGDDASKLELDNLKTGEDNLATLDKMLARAQAQNSHIPRSQIETRATFRKPREPSPMLDEFPEEERYSKKFGLGPRWTRSLIYPKAGKKKTTVDWSDLERLDEGQYLNDNLIGFYLRFLEHQVEEKNPELLKKVYFFNTFFFASLTNTQRGKRPINYESVQKWTRGIDLFTYDYVVVPINEAAHWYVAIICNLPELIQPSATEEDQIAARTQSDSEHGVEVANEKAAHSVDPVASPSALIEAPFLLDSNNDRPEEQDPTASFADMSLETEAEKPRADRLKDGGIGVSAGSIMADQSTEEDQEMLDAQLQENITESSILEDAGPSERPKAVMGKDGPIAEDPSSNASCSKKRKRRSIPPIKKIDATQPAIITFDSLGAPHPPTIRILKHYLREEGVAKRNGMEFDDSRLKGLTAKQIPQQDNFSDCGLFLLGYVEKFLENPNEFVGRVVKREYDIKKDWPKMDPSEMRNSLRTLIQDLRDGQENERWREKTAHTRTTGKSASKQQQEPEPHPSTDTLQTDETNRQLTKVPDGPNHNYDADLGPRSEQTRREASQGALTIGSQEPSKPAAEPRKPPTKDQSTESTKIHVEPITPTLTVPKDPSIITIDSQPEAINSSTQLDVPESRISSPELGSEIADSQPPNPSPSSPPTLPKPLPEETEYGTSHDGLPTTSFDPVVVVGQDEIEESRGRLRRPTERERVRQRSVVEIDD